MIVYRDRFPDSASGRRTVVAIDPTRSEWWRFFPNGAAGVLCKDGRLLVGDGDCLDHLTVLEKAGVPADQEAYRLQLLPGRFWAEVWLRDSDEDVDRTEDMIRAQVVADYGETLEAIAKRVEVAVGRFADDVEVRAIPLGEDQECLIEGDQEFRSGSPEPNAFSGP